MTESLIRRKPAPEWRIMYRPREGLYKMEGPRRTALMPPGSDCSDACRRTWEVWALETLGPLAEKGWVVTEDGGHRVTWACGKSIKAWLDCPEEVFYSTSPGRAYEDPVAALAYLALSLLRDQI